jgi:hypothetical protein
VTLDGFLWRRMMIHAGPTCRSATTALESRTGLWPRNVPRATLGTGDMVDMRRGIDFSSWEHMLADGNEERQGGVTDGASETSLVKSRP